MEKPKISYVDKTFRLRLPPEVMKWVLKDRGTNPKGNRNIPSRSTEFFHWYSVYRKGFLIHIIENNFEECRHLLRKIGRARKEAGSPILSS